MTAELVDDAAASGRSRTGDIIEDPCGPWWLRAGWRLFFLLCRLTRGRPFLRGSGELQRMSLVEKLFWVYKRHHTVRGDHLSAETIVGAGGWRLATRTERAGVLVATGELSSYSPTTEPATLHVSVGLAEAVAGDLAFANLEGAIGQLDRGTGEAPRLAVSRSDFETLHALFDGSPTIISLANNHVLDSTDEQITETIAYLDERQVRVVGVADPGADPPPAVQRIGDVAVSFLATTFASNRPTTGRQIALRVDPLHSRPADAVAGLSRDIDALRRSTGADVVCLSAHWGHEFEWRPRRAVQALARELAEAGADLILGHHPHVIQPTEIHRCRDGRQVPIAYSLGNLVTTIMWPHLRLGLVARVELGRAGDRAFVTGVSLVPTVLSRLEGSADELVLESLSETRHLRHTRSGELDLMGRYADFVLREGLR